MDALNEEAATQSEREQIASILDYIRNEVVIPDENIISRRNNSGVQLSESVNLDLNPDNDLYLFSEQEQQGLITALNNLSREEIKQIASGDLSVIERNKILVQNIRAKSYLENPNAYYTDFIIDSINLDEIYKAGNISEEKKRDLKQKIGDKLSNVDAYKLYKAFIEAGIDYKEAPSYIINLILEDGYGKNDTFEKLAQAEDLNTIIKDNINNFNKKITPFLLDSFLEILDNSSEVDGTFMKLRDYQQEAVDGIERIFENRNFAGVVLPTGAGKSFVAMTEMMKYQKRNIVYFAP